MKQPSIRPEKRSRIYKNINILSNDEFIKNNLQYKITIKKIIKILVPNKLKKYIMKVKGMKND